MNQKKALRKRDIYMMSILFVVFAAMFFVVQYVIFAGDAVYAYIYYGIDDPMVTIDFSGQEVIRNFDQDVPDTYDIAYPLIGDNVDGYVEIIVLGDYEIDGVRQEVIIEVDFNQNRVRVKDEESPQHICSNQGWSTAIPLICLPNQVRVEFDSTTSDLDFIQ